MKRLLLTIVAIAAIALPACAQSASSLIKEFKDEKGAEYEKVSSFTMGIAKLFGDKKSKKIDSVQMLELEDCSDETRRRFGEKLKKLNLNGYETFMQMSDEGEKVKILAKVKNEKIRELLILQSDDEYLSGAVILVKCKLERDEIGDVISITMGGK